MSYSLKQFMICISGYSSSGKDEFARVFVDEMQAPKVGLADPAKRHMADLYGFTEDQLFGPSAMRNSGDIRYPKPEFAKAGLSISKYSADSPPPGLNGVMKPGVSYWETMRPLRPAFVFFKDEEDNFISLTEEGDPAYWLSPRESLQKYCELMNLMYGDTWIRKSIDTHFRLGATVERGSHRFMRHSYDRMLGMYTPGEDKLIPAPESGGSFFSCSADFRHRHEFNLTKKMKTDDFIPVMVRVRRSSVPVPPFDHRSETEQATIPDSFFDFVVSNDKTIEDLHEQAREIIRTVQTPGWQPLRGML